MATVIVKPGACGLESTIVATKESLKKVNIQIESACPHIQNMQEDLQSINGMNECFAKFGSSQIYTAANKHCKHLACPVPTGIVKVVEVACEFAVARDVEMKISK